MAQIAFDTLEYFEKLKSAGVSESQAKVQVEAMQGVINSYDMATRKELATKDDIQDVRNEIAETKHEILKWVVTAMIAQTALLVGIIAFLR